MLSSQKKDLSKGILLMGGFLIILAMLFMPIIKGTTPVHFLDQLYNTISKGSVYYIDQLKEEAKQYRGKPVSISWKADTPAQAERIEGILKRNGIAASYNANEIDLQGDLGSVVAVVLRDSDSMFHNRGADILQRYNIPEKLLLYDWWHILKATEKGLTRTRRFEEAKFIHSVLTKAVECAYNYYGIEARNIVDQAYLVILSLLFYVLYTIWLGFAILLLLKGLGLKLEDH